MDANNMGLFLLDCRKRKNLTQKDLAMLCNVSTQAVSKWERGESFPDIEILEKLSILYDISINELINGEKRTKFVDIDKRKNVISLTFSILVFFAYLLSFVQLPIWGITTIFKGYEIIANGISGVIIIFSWVVFLILISYLILNIFLLAKVIEKTKLFNAYFLFSYFVIIGLSLFGLLAEYYLFLSQAIILICATIIFTQSISKEELKSIEVHTWASDMMKRVQLFFKTNKELKKNYINDKKNMKDVHVYKTSTYMNTSSFVLFDTLYVCVTLFLGLIIAGIVVNSIQEPDYMSLESYIIVYVVFCDFIYLVYSMRYINTVLFGAKLRMIAIFHMCAYLFFLIVYSLYAASWISVILPIIIIIYFLYSNKLLSYAKDISNK